MTPVIETVKGKLQGLETEAGFVYKGVPYAAAPVGELRFCPPQPAEE